MDQRVSWIRYPLSMLFARKGTFDLLLAMAQRWRSPRRQLSLQMYRIYYVFSQNGEQFKLTLSFPIISHVQSQIVLVVTLTVAAVTRTGNVSIRCCGNRGEASLWSAMQWTKWMETIVKWPAVMYDIEARIHTHPFCVGPLGPALSQWHSMSLCCDVLCDVGFLWMTDLLPMQQLPSHSQTSAYIFQTLSTFSLG